MKIRMLILIAFCIVIACQRNIGGPFDNVPTSCGDTVMIEGKLYKKENGNWFVYENNYRFKVVNEVTIKFKNENEDVEKFSIENDLEFIRKNEFSYIDFKFSQKYDPICFILEIQFVNKDKIEHIFPATKMIPQR